MALSEIPHCVNCKHSLHSQANTKSMINWFQYDQIGATCSCGSCKCGNCSPGGNFITLKVENELEQIKDCLTFRPEGDEHRASSHCDAKYPFLISANQLPDNYRAVKGVLLSTLR